MTSERVAEALAGAVAEAGGSHVFGVPGGGSNLDFVGACEDAGLRFVLSHGETAGAIMAATVAELTGRPAACLATRGPGAASMVNGVAHALQDRCPILAVTDAVPARARGRVTHQRLDQHGLFAAAAKRTLDVCTHQADALAAAAVAIARLPPWGPVHVDTVPDAPPSEPPVPTAPPAPQGLAHARKILAASHRPILCVGVGARFAESGVLDLARQLSAPVLTTYKAKGAVPDGDDLAAGMLTGGTAEARALNAADLIVMIGVDPIELIPGPWPYRAPVLKLGPWPTGDPHAPIALDVVGDLGELLPELGNGMSAREWPVEGRELRQAVVEALDIDAPGLTAAEVVRATQESAPDAIATVDAGAHMLVAMPLWEAQAPRSVLISSGLATMGFSLPAALAAACVEPERRVICLTGDGGLGMCLAELETLARMDCRLTVVVLNDGELSLIRIKQRPDGHGGPGAVRYAATDFAAIARGCGLAAERVDDRGGLRAALRRANERPGPGLVDAVIDPTPYPAVMEVIRGHA